MKVLLLLRVIYDETQRRDLLHDEDHNNNNNEVEVIVACLCILRELLFRIYPSLWRSNKLSVFFCGISYNYFTV
jgi:hypothetical protein